MDRKSKSQEARIKAIRVPRTKKAGSQKSGQKVYDGGSAVGEKTSTGLDGGRAF